MSEDWIGFTDEDLRRLKGQDGARKANSGGRPASTRGHGPQRGRPQKQRQPMQKPTASPQSSRADLEPSMMLSETTKPKPSESPEKCVVPQSKSAEESKIVSDNEKDDTNATPTMQDPDKTLGKELNEKEFVERELSNADKFQIQQKIMEEQNKKKQELLAMAIVERQKKAKAESNKLVRIQRELATLDRILHADVTIIRDKIEEASREFLEAQKRYDRAEQEFIEAKIDLHRKSETKESLTEHLYTIIHQNEIRKAKKLTELMEKLQLEADEEASAVQVDLSGLPSMALLNAIHTLEPGSPTSPPINSEIQSVDSIPAQDTVSQQGEVKTDSTEKDDQNTDSNITNSVSDATPQGSQSSPQNESPIKETKGETDTVAKKDTLNMETQAADIKVMESLDQNDNKARES